MIGRRVEITKGRDSVASGVSQQGKKVIETKFLKVLWED